LRVGYFVDEDVARYGLSEEQQMKLAEAFSGFKFDRNYRDRNRIPAVMGARNFFDDVGMQFLRKGIVPTSKELAVIYEDSVK